MITSKEELIRKLAALPDEIERKYEKEIMTLAMIGQKTDFDKWAKSVMELPDDAPCTDVKKLLETAGVGNEENFNRWVDELMALPASDDAEQEKAVFGAFCIRVGQLRRNQDRSQENRLMNEYRERFGSKHPFYNHLDLMRLLDQNPENQAQKVLELGERNRTVMPLNAGVHHAFAIAVADIFEATELTPEKRPDKEWLEKGERAAIEALDLDPDYPKFHCTKGRILALKGDYQQALREIAIAIDTENSKQADYALRIGNYRTYEQRIREKQRSEEQLAMVQKQIDSATALSAKMEASLTEMKDKQAELEEETRASLAKNMEFLGLFSGIVSFTIGGISISGAVAERSILGAAGLIVVLMGALLTVFSGFGIILHGYEGEKSKRNKAVLLMGILVAAVGVLLCYI